MTSGFYQQPWAQAHPGTPSVAIQVKTPPPSSIASTYGLPPPPVTATTPAVTNRLSVSSRQQSPSVERGINHLGGGGHIPVRTPGSSGNPGVSNVASSRYAQTSATAAIGSRINALYSDRVSPARSTGAGPTVTASGGGINVTVNGTSNSNIKKYVQQHPPQAAVRTSIPSAPTSSSTGRIHTNLAGGGVSVSVGRSPSYGNHLNTVGATTTMGRSTASAYASNNTSNYGNPNNNGAVGMPPTHHLHHQQRQRTAHPHPPTHPSHPQHHQREREHGNSNKSSSVPVLTQSRTNLQQQTQSQSMNHPIPPTNGPQQQQHFTKQVLLTSAALPSKETVRRLMDTPDGEVSQVKMTVGPNCGYGAVSSFPSASPLKTAKGILRREGQKRKMSVTFPQEVSHVFF